MAIRCLFNPWVRSVHNLNKGAPKLAQVIRIDFVKIDIYTCTG